MDSLKCVVRSGRVKPEPKNDTSTDDVLKLSVTVGYLAADVHKEEILKLKRLLVELCVAGLVSLERGEVEQHLHFQMVCQARTKSARSFGILIQKYMDWFGKRNMSPAGKVTCKVLTKRLLHTWKGMVGYCMKDSALTHFEVEMHNITDADVVAGKTLHTIYRRADLKSRVILTNKNVGERAYVWFKYKENRQLKITMLSMLTDMIKSALFIPSASWIIPLSGLGMEQRRMNSFWKCLTDPTNIDKAEVANVFIQKREFVRGRYYDVEDHVSPVQTPDGMEYEYIAPVAGKVSDTCKPVSPSVKRVVLSTASVGPGSKDAKQEKLSTAFKVGVPKRSSLSDEELFSDRPIKTVKFADQPREFVPLVEIAPLPTNVYLPTLDALTDSCVTKTPLTEAAFWKSLSNNPLFAVSSGDSAANGDGAEAIPWSASVNKEDMNIVTELSFDCEDDDKRGTNHSKIIEISSDSDRETQKNSAWPDTAAKVVEDRKPAEYFFASNIVSYKIVDPDEEEMYSD